MCPKITDKFLNKVYFKATLQKKVMERSSHSLTSDMTPSIAAFLCAEVTQISESYKYKLQLPITATLAAKGK